MAQPTSAARPKRAGEDFAREFNSSSTSKKPRFDARNPSTLAPDAPEHDPVLDADVIGKSGRQVKRNAVNIDGYDSDSDVEKSFDLRAADLAKKKDQSEDAEEDDMFAEPETGNGNEKAGKKKKDVRFLESGKILGESKKSKSGGHVSAELLKSTKGKDYRKDKKRRNELSESSGSSGDEEDDGDVSSSSSSGDDEDRDLLPDIEDEELALELGAGSKKKHAPRLDAFNLREELEDGQYDENGNYIRKAVDPDASNDNWLEGVTKRDIKRAKEAKDKQEKEMLRKELEEDALHTEDLLSTLIRHLRTSETYFEALGRLHAASQTKSKKQAPKWKKNKDGESKMDVHGPPAADTDVDDTIKIEEQKRKAAIEAMTEAASALLSRGYSDIYEASREVLMRHYQREAGRDWQPPADWAEGNAAATMFEYRWVGQRDGRHGPFDAATMNAWNEAGYFEQGVEFRRVGESGWSRVLDVS